MLRRIRVGSLRIALFDLENLVRRHVVQRRLLAIGPQDFDRLGFVRFAETEVRARIAAGEITFTPMTGCSIVMPLALTVTAAPMAITPVSLRTGTTLSQFCLLLPSLRSRWAGR